MNGPNPIREIAEKTSAATVPVAVRRAETAQFVEFEIDGQRYAFSITQIREIVILHSVTPTPQVAAYVDGVSNLRGAIIPIIQLRVLFGLPRKPGDEETRTIVVTVGEKTIGCTVDAVTQVLRLAHDAIQPAPDIVRSDHGPAIAGFAKVDDRLVIVLDVDRLLDVENLHQVPIANLAEIHPHGD